MPRKLSWVPSDTQREHQIDASPEELKEAEELHQQITEAEEKLRKSTAAVYHDKPAQFVMDCISWRHGEAPTRYQLANLQRLVKHGRLAVRGPHGLGKTTTNAWTVLWFALTRDAAEEDWKIATTASAWLQLTHYLWPEIHKWSRRIKWKRVGRDPFTREELLRHNLRLKYGEAFAAACEDPAKLEGMHADQVLYIYDEAKTIPAETFDASEGAFSGAGASDQMEAYALASSTPGEPIGRFYEIHAHKPGLQSWTTVHVKLQDAIKANRVSKDWQEEKAEQWGTDSAIYINRVLGNFAAAEEDGVIALGHVEMAIERWEKLRDAGWPELGELTVIGADIARSGADRTVLAMRYGYLVKELQRFHREDTMQTAGHITVAVFPTENRAKAVVDVAGIGAGVVDRLKEDAVQVIAFNASERSDLVDRHGALRFINARAAAWWNLRDMLLPDSGFEVALPNDELLIGDLTAPKWKMSSGGKVQVESKEDIRKRIGRSTDDGDAVTMAFYTETGPLATAPIFTTKRSRWEPIRQSARW